MLKLDYEKFDKIIENELINPITLSEIVNDSHCVNSMINVRGEDENFPLGNIYSGLKGKFGVYAFWTYRSDFENGNEQMFKCQYIGKGYIDRRLKDNLEKKWKDMQSMYFTFFECKNRLAKYIEQLILDCYDIPYNKAENPGEGELVALWNYERATYGTGA
ncbi:hypothetical protein ACXZ7F_26595 [Vibrio harveyi]